MTALPETAHHRQRVSKEYSQGVATDTRQYLEKQIAGRELTDDEVNEYDKLQDQFYTLVDQIKKEGALSPLIEAKRQLDALKQNPDVRMLLGDDQAVIDRVIPQFLGKGHLRFDDLLDILDVKFPSRDSKKHGKVRDNEGQRILDLVKAIRDEMVKPEVQKAIMFAKKVDDLYQDIDARMFDAESKAKARLTSRSPELDDRFAEQLAERDPHAQQLQRLKESVYKRLRDIESLIGPG
jgi:hypothetical protein